MKSITCNELGGACDKVFQANTFDEIVTMSKQHGMDMFLRGDKGHLEAISKLRVLMQSADGMTAWMDDKRKLFEARADIG